MLKGNKKTKSLIGDYFTLDERNESLAICNLCPHNDVKKKVNRGKKNFKSGYSTKNLKIHLEKFHKETEEYKKFLEHQKTIKLQRMEIELEDEVNFIEK